MGVCGAAQICRGDNNPKSCNMAPPQNTKRPISLSSVKDVGFEHDRRPHSPHKTHSDSDTSTMMGGGNIHPPMNTRQSHSHHSSDSDIDNDLSKYPSNHSTKITVQPSVMNKSRQSHQMGSTPPAPAPVKKINPNIGVSSRQSNKYIPLPDPPSPNIDIDIPVTNVKMKQTRSNPVVFRRERHRHPPTLQPAFSAELIKEAEHALLDESTIIQKNSDITCPWLVTPVATPSHNTINKNKYNIQIKERDNSFHGNGNNTITGSPIYPVDFTDENKKKLWKGAGSNSTGNAGTGPISNFNTSIASNSATATPSKNRNNYNKIQMIGDDINVNYFYTNTREPNLSMSVGPNLLGIPNNNPFPRISSTSSDFTHLIEQERQRGNSQTNKNDNIFDENIDIQWRFSHGGSMTGMDRNNLNVTGSHLPIDRTENGSLNSLTDL